MGGEGAGRSASVDLVECLGESGYVHLRLPIGQAIIAESRGETGLRPDDRACAMPDASHAHLFDASGSRTGRKLLQTMGTFMVA